MSEAREQRERRVVDHTMNTTLIGQYLTQANRAERLSRAARARGDLRRAEAYAREAAEFWDAARAERAKPAVRDEIFANAMNRS